MPQINVPLSCLLRDGSLDSLTLALLTAHEVWTRSMDLFSLDLKQFCANMWVSMLGVRSRAPSARSARDVQLSLRE